MIRETLKGATIFALTALCALAVQAGEISLYENSGFGGRQVTLRDYTPNISEVGFNDRASSVVVRSGRWEVCTDADFKGYCAVMERGEYRTLDPSFNDRISSAREVGTTGSVAVPPMGRGSIELFGQPGFRGKGVSLDKSADNFAEFNFNDRASSVIVHGGTWVLCTDAGFRGTCRTYAPGRYADLGPGMNRLISSARLDRGPQEAAPVHGGGWQSPPATTNPSSVILYGDEGLRGRSMALSGNVVDLGQTGFNDVAASLVIQSGYWEFCSDANFRGQCRVLGPGQYRRLDPALVRSISSVRFASREGSAGMRPIPGRAEIELFSEPAFAGNRFAARDDVGDLAPRNFNDRASSIVVYSGQWEVCTDADFGGRCTVFGPGRYGELGGLSNRISSLRKVY